MNTLVFGNQHDETLDMLLLAEKDIDITNVPSYIRTVSASSPQSSLPFIEEDKSYLLHKFRNQSNQMMIYISEVKQTQQPKVLY
jgi:hypothetical protein